MKAKLKLKPGEKGTKGLLKKYGDDLICVRYRYDEATQTRLKTVEIIVEKKEWIPPQPMFDADAYVPVRIAYKETLLKNMAKTAGGRWDPEARMWFIPFCRIKGTTLEKHIVLDAIPKPGK